MIVTVYRFVEPQLVCLIIHLQFVPNFELCSFEFLLVFFVSQARISLLGKVNWFGDTVDVGFINPGSLMDQLPNKSSAQ